VYLEVSSNLKTFKGFTNGQFKTWKINGIECCKFSSQLKTNAMAKLLKHTFDMKKMDGSKVNSAMLSAIFGTKDIQRLSKLTDSMLEGHPKYKLDLRLDNIRKNNLEIYRSLFKKSPAGGGKGKAKSS